MSDTEDCDRGDFSCVLRYGSRHEPGIAQQRLVDDGGGGVAVMAVGGFAAGGVRTGSQRGVVTGAVPRRTASSNEGMECSLRKCGVARPICDGFSYSDS